MSNLPNDRLFINNIGDLVEIQRASYYSFLQKTLIDELTKTTKSNYQIFSSKDIFGFEEFFFPNYYIFVEEFPTFQTLVPILREVSYFYQALENEGITMLDEEKTIKQLKEENRNGFTCQIPSSVWMGIFDSEDVFLDFPKEDCEVAAKFGETYSFNLGFYTNYYSVDQLEIPDLYDRCLFLYTNPLETVLKILEESHFILANIRQSYQMELIQEFNKSELLEELSQLDKELLKLDEKLFGLDDNLKPILTNSKFVKFFVEVGRKFSPYVTEKSAGAFFQNMAALLQPKIFSLNKLTWNFAKRKIGKANIFQLSLLEILDKKKKTIFDFCFKLQTYWGTIPLMTKEGTFIINGCERVVISQAVKSPGVIFQKTQAKKKKYKATLITTSLNKYDFEFVTTFDTIYSKFCKLIVQNYKNDYADALEDGYTKSQIKKFRIVKLAYELDDLQDLLLLVFDLGFIPRYSLKINSSLKLSFPDLLSSLGISTTEFFDSLDIPVFFPWSPEKILEDSYELYNLCLESQPDDEDYKSSEDESEELKNLLEIFDLFAYYLNETENQAERQKKKLQKIKEQLQKFEANFEETEKIEDKEKKRKDFDAIDSLSIGSVGRHRMNKKFFLSFPLSITDFTAQDLAVTLNQLYKVEIGQRDTDDIDDLKNKLIRGVGEQLHQNIISRSSKISENTFRNKRAEDMDVFRTFFVQNPLSQYFDQLNPLSEVTHKRRVSVFGEEGIERGGAITSKMRDIHPSYYGKFCPIETPEGENAGLVTTLAVFAKKSSLGLLEAPYYYAQDRKLFIQHAPLFLDGYDEISSNFLLSSYALESKKSLFPEDYFVVKEVDDFIPVFSSEINFAALHSSQILSIATSLVPFIEHNDGNRALMGANMQRQALPLLSPNLPIVGTGFESIASLASGSAIRSHTEGYVTYASSSLIEIKDKKNQIVSYLLKKYKRSNQATSLNQNPCVWIGEYIFRGQIIADTPSTINGELSLGMNLTVAYMPWQGYNYEDAIVISENLVLNDVLTSLHIESFEDEYFPESDIFTSSSDILNLSPALTLNLTSEGIVRLGSYVRAGDILVGKATISPSEFSPVKNFLSLISPQSSKYQDSLEKKYKNKSLTVPESVEGRVIDISFNASFDDIGFLTFPKSKIKNLKNFLKALSKDPQFTFSFLSNFDYFRTINSNFLSYVRDLSNPSLKKAKKKGKDFFIPETVEKVFISFPLSFEEFILIKFFPLYKELHEEKIKAKTNSSTFLEILKGILKQISLVKTLLKQLNKLSKKVKKKILKDSCVKLVLKNEALQKYNAEPFLYAKNIIDQKYGHKKKFVYRPYFSGSPDLDFNQLKGSKDFFYRVRSILFSNKFSLEFYWDKTRKKISNIPLKCDEKKLGKIIESLKKNLIFRLKTCLLNEKKSLVNRIKSSLDFNSLRIKIRKKKRKIFLQKLFPPFFPYAYFFPQKRLKFLFIFLSKILAKKKIFISPKNLLICLEKFKPQGSKNSSFLRKKVYEIPLKFSEEWEQFLEKICVKRIRNKKRNKETKLPLAYNRRVCDIEAPQFFETEQSYFVPYYLAKKTLVSPSKLSRDYSVISKITLVQSRKIEVGDKLSGRHGNKGIISRILPVCDMPMLPTGESVDILLNPLGVPSRMNVGQLLEALLGFAGEKLGKRFKAGSFDEAYGIEASRSFVTLKLKEAAFQANEKWLFTPDYPGKVFLRDGQTGEYFDNPTTIGKAYILKLLHVVHDKIHTRSIGPYNLVTQQPLGGKANNGGQRFGEMEVWALEAHGCSYTLQELLTLRSDDLDGRVDISNAMMNEWQEKIFNEGLKTKEGKRLIFNFSYDPKEYPHPSSPQAYIGLVRELNALGLDFTFHQIVHETKGFNSQEEDIFTQLERKLKLKLLIERYEFELFFDIEDQKKAEKEAQEKLLKEAKENEKNRQLQSKKKPSTKKIVEKIKKLKKKKEND